MNRGVELPDAAFLVVVEDELELELEPEPEPELEPVDPEGEPEAVPEAVEPALEPLAVAEPLPLVTAVQTPRLVVPVMYVALTDGRYIEQAEFDRTEASKLERAASWLLRAGPLALYHERTAEE